MERNKENQGIGGSYGGGKENSQLAELPPGELDRGKEQKVVDKQIQSQQDVQIHHLFHKHAPPFPNRNRPPEAAGAVHPAHFSAVCTLPQYL